MPRADHPMIPLDIFDDMPEPGSMLDPVYPIIRVTGEIDQALASEFTSSLNLLQQRGETCAIIDISSPGGDVMALFQMLNAMDASGITLATYNSSYAYSAGAVLLSAGAEGARFVAPLSSTMLHPMSCEVPMQPIADVAVHAAHDAALNEMMLDRLAHNMGISRSKLLKELQSAGGSSTLWLTPQQAVKLNVADLVGIPSFSKQVTLTVSGVTDPPSKTPSIPSKTK